MKKIINCNFTTKSFVSAMVVLCLIFTVFNNVAKAEESICDKSTAIESGIQKINDKYGTNLTFDSRMTQTFETEELLKEMTEIAKHEKAVTQYIEYRKKNQNLSLPNARSLYASTNWVTKTQTKSTSSKMVQIRCTFQERYNPMRRVSYISSSAFCSDYYASRRYAYYPTSYRHYRLDSGRTLAVKYTGTMKIRGIPAGTTTAYAEF